jgi:hypothetical protein
VAEGHKNQKFCRAIPASSNYCGLNRPDKALMLSVDEKSQIRKYSSFAGESELTAHEAARWSVRSANIRV